VSEAWLLPVETSKSKTKTTKLKIQNNTKMVFSACDGRIRGGEDWAKADCY
jgi:hypothetical protein